MRTILGCVAVCVAACAADAPSSTTTPPPGTPPDSAEAYFDTNVYPMLVQNCGQGGCHAVGGNLGTGFIYPTATATYAALTADGTSGIEPLVTVPEGAHYAAWTANETEILETWIGLENAN
ncbi:MAG TPA: hypothetical protein VMJ10_26890 [Kofleriaceae bacterium]|nr:hypothetical protein [Kofleriaceae bacterium]